MWICEHCGRLYDGDFGTHYECHGHSDYYAEKVDNDAVCGTCGGNYVEATECKICGQWFNNEGWCGVCEDCLDKEMTAENAFEVGEHDYDRVEINGALRWVFDEKKINEILFDYLKANREQYAKDISEYLNEDVSVLAELLVERKNGLVNK
jgi:hypothetical protein